MTGEIQDNMNKGGVGIVLPHTILRQLSENTLHPEHVRVTVATPGGTLRSPVEYFPDEKSPLLWKKGADSDVFVPGPEEEEEQESMWSVTGQVLFPFIIAGFGTVGAGLLLDVVQHWAVFQAVPEMFVLVPALLGLKGNLEMTLASRISTLANLGTIDSTKEQWRMAAGNLALLQCQSLVLGFLASAFASVVGWIEQGEFNIDNILLLSASSLVTASLASLLLGAITIAVVVYSRKFNINPDNVAAPISASLGDVITLGLLASISSFQFSVTGSYRWAEISVVVGMLLLIPIWAFFSYHNQYTRQVLYTGWVPVISAVIISSGGGYILNFAVSRFKEIAAYQPIINGVGGNLVAVQACRISTYLHLRAKPGCLLSPDDLCISPFVAWFGKNTHARTTRILVLLSIPGHLLFTITIHFLKSNYTPMSFQFLLFYMLAAVIQVSVLLYFAYCIVHWLWRWSIDPDDAAIPFLTALGDLLGTGLLLLAFLLMEITYHQMD